MSEYNLYSQTNRKPTSLYGLFSVLYCYRPRLTSVRLRPLPHRTKNIFANSLLLLNCFDYKHILARSRQFCQIILWYIIVILAQKVQD